MFSCKISYFKMVEIGTKEWQNKIFSKKNLCSLIGRCQLKKVEKSISKDAQDFFSKESFLQFIFNANKQDNYDWKYCTNFVFLLKKYN